MKTSNGVRKVHMIGIAGVGMSATAVLLKEAGWQITGSDSEAYGPPKRILTKARIDFARGYDPKNIPTEVDCFIIGRNAKLVPEENTEVKAAHDSGKPIYSFPEIIGELTEKRENIVVAGSYGKSTMTSLIAHIVRHTGTDAGYFIGAEPIESPWLPAPAKIGSASLFVLEGDEYPSGHGDARAKFMHFHPRDILLTSVVHDHVNVYPTFDSYKKPFEDLLQLVPEEGLVITCADEPGARALAGEGAVTYGLQNGSFRAKDISYGEKTTFTMVRDGAVLGALETKLLGTHNVENIVGAAAYVLTKKLATFEQIARAVKDFKGVRRKLDNVAPTSKVPVYEGFGSSYEKARSAIAAIRLHYKEKPLVIVFEPHTFGWRNRANLGWYDDAFEEAEKVFVASPETQGADTHDQLSHEEIRARIDKTGVETVPYMGPEEVVESLAGAEVVLILTSGDFHGTLEKLVEDTGKKFS